MARSDTAGSYGSSAFSFLRNHYTYFHIDYTNLYPHQQYVSVPLSPHPHCCLFSSWYPFWLGWDEISLAFLFLFFGGTRVWTQGFTLAKQALYRLSNTSSPFCSGYFGDGISQTICMGWSWTVILPVLASQVARIIGMNCIGTWQISVVFIGISLMAKDVNHFLIYYWQYVLLLRAVCSIHLLIC
jgi:hypothetical protein